MARSSHKKFRWLSVMITLTVIQFLCMLLPLWWLSGWLESQWQTIPAEYHDHPLPGLAEPGDSEFWVWPNCLGCEVYATVSRATAGLQLRGTSIAALLALLGGVLAAISVGSYEARLERINRELETQVEHRSQALVKTRDATIFGLAKLAEWRDDETGGHLERIRSYVEILATQLSETHPELDREAVRMLGITSSLHDIGKVGIPDAVLLKQGPLTDEERRIIERHPLIAGNCLMAIKEHLGQDDFLQVACEIALCHHERWDGSGYPYGLVRDQIPLAARIVALADVYDALTSNRCYKDAMPHEVARRVIVKEAGRHFDPEVVDAFVAAEDRFCAIALRSRPRSRFEDFMPLRLTVEPVM